VNNGVIFQKRENRTYQGVDGDNWYLNALYPDSFEGYFENKIELSWRDDSYVDVCNDPEYINEYIRVSTENKIDYRIILCCTDNKLPDGSNIMWGGNFFLGYDYAYSGGSYYSAIYNELHFERLDEYKNILLNKYGLLDSKQEMNRYLEIRNGLLERGCNLELGDFVIFELYEIEKDGIFLK
jgi:hypothetical protein